MTPERWQQIEQLYHEALERPADQRAAFLEEACAHDEALHHEVDGLLKAHIEAEQVPAFALTAARGGLKIKPAAPGACEPAPGRPGTPPPNAQSMAPPRGFADVRRGQKPTCGMLGQRNGPNMVFVGGEVPFSALTGPIAFRLGGVRVLDKTGVTDRFNFVLEFADDAKPLGLPPGDLHDHPEPTDIPQAATIFTALEEELGLKLEPARAPREFVADGDGLRCPAKPCELFAMRSKDVERFDRLLGDGLHGLFDRVPVRRKFFRLPAVADSADWPVAR